MSSSCFFLSFVLLLQLLSTTTALNSTTDQNSLLALKNAITSDPDGVLAKNWSENSYVCHWIGVYCGHKHQRVVSLNISGFGLLGTLPPHLGNLTFLRYFDIGHNRFNGPVPSEMSRLHRRLRVINMGANLLSGEIPSWFGSFPQLEELLLNDNTFSGPIPPSLFNSNISKKLWLIDLTFNHLSGSIPEEIANCSSLQVIAFGFNRLTGSIPNDMCNNLANLRILSLSSNQIEGRIPPNIWKCRELEILSLPFNHFTGEIPSEIGSLIMLKGLFLGKNDFTGHIPKQIGNCTYLVRLNLHDNSFTGELPQELGNLAFLERLSVFNNSLSGSIPSSIFNISTLTVLELSFNQFSGVLNLPSELPLFNLERLYLSVNELSGEIPSSIVNASRLIILELSNNSFVGNIPNFGNLKLLEVLRLPYNKLTGVVSPNQKLEFVSSLSNCRFLKELVISGNPLNGILPDSIGNLSTSLTWIDANACNLTGVIPNTIGNLISLRKIDLGRNQVTGFIPPVLCHLRHLGNLYLHDNLLRGPIPECLGEVDSLREIDMHSNKLSSTIPSRLWNLTYLVVLNLSSNSLRGQLSSRVFNLKAINQLDLSHNQISGDIPSSIVGCRSLEFLSVSNNKFEGPIPESLGSIRGLSSLDFSDNNLSGLIPESLQNLNVLRFFNVSQNKLRGEIPTGGCFANFSARSFLNNPDLCGATRFHVPPCIKKKGRESRLVKKVGQLMKYILPPLFSVIIIIIIIVLVFWRTRTTTQVPILVENPLRVDAWRRVSHMELVRGTNSFGETNLLGRGGFGSVFRATLSDGLNVAVKVFNLQSERAVRSFETECEILSNIRHRNLVRIIGCCSNTEFKALILGYMPNGSLEKWLYSENFCPDLIQLLKIAIDVASAVEYLHHGYTSSIVHCDIKPSNVLLDEDMVAHVADFGMAKLFEDGETVVQTKTLATIGYAAPEYGSQGNVSTNGDVYSYGILLLEMFTRKKPTDDMFSGEFSLKEWVQKALQENSLSEVVDPGLLAAREDQYFCAKEECVSSIFSLGIQCLAGSPHERIPMIEIVAGLQRIKAKFVADTTRREQRGIRLMKLNRILRPGGYFVWSATPVYRLDEKHQNAWNVMVALSESICWTIAAKTFVEASQVGLVVFQKPVSSSCYQNRVGPTIHGTYVPLDTCLVPIMDDSHKWPAPWPQRLSGKPPSLSVESDAEETFKGDTRHWSALALVSEVYLGGLDLNWSNVRNVMDMIAGYGGFVAALISQPI